MHARFLMATLRIPVRVGVDGDLILLNEYSKIEIGEMDGPITTKTNETIYNKVIDYLAREEDEEPIKEHEEEEESIEDDEEPREEEPVKEDEEPREEEDEPREEEQQREPPKYKFPYMKKSKKPMNITFRARNKSQNFTKRVYCL